LLLIRVAGFRALRFRSDWKGIVNAETKKDVAEQRDARLRAQGAAGLGKRLWGTVVAVATLVSTAVTTLFHLRGH
jgi:hypothetical protein